MRGGRCGLGGGGGGGGGCVGGGRGEEQVLVVTRGIQYSMFFCFLLQNMYTV